MPTTSPDCFRRATCVPTPIYPDKSGRKISLPNAAYEMGTPETDPGPYTSTTEDLQKNRWNRTKARLAASLAGIRELDILREKHRRMIQEVKTHLAKSQSNLNEIGSSCHPGYPGTCHQPQWSLGEGLPISGPGGPPITHFHSYSYSGGSYRPHSPFTDISSHRSSLSMDSGCISISSDASKHSCQPSLDSTYTQGYAAANGAGLGAGPSDDEGVMVDGPKPQAVTRPPPIRRRKPGLLQPRPKSLYSYPEENTVLVTEHMLATPAYGLLQRLTLNDQQTAKSARPDAGVLVSYRRNTELWPAKAHYAPAGGSASARSGSGLRHSQSFSQGPKSACARPHSMAFPPPIRTASTCHVPTETANQRDSFTWEDAKRLLTADYKTRPPVLRRHMSNTCLAGSPSQQSPKSYGNRRSLAPTFESVYGTPQNNLTSPSSPDLSIQEGGPSAVVHIRTGGHITRSPVTHRHRPITRSLSSQSTDSNKSRKSREKGWHESEQL